MKIKISNSMKFRSAAIVLFSIIVISISAQLTIPVSDIPVTGQTLSILIIALLLKPKETFLVLLGYLTLGGLGLPIFADGASGFEKFSSGSGGFLIGFIFGSTFISYLFQFVKSKNALSILLLTCLGTIIILIFGVGRLSMLYGLEKGIEYGFTPFWKGAILKVIIGTFITFAIFQYKKKLPNKS